MVCGRAKEQDGDGTDSYQLSGFGSSARVKLSHDIQCSNYALKELYPYLYSTSGDTDASVYSSLVKLVGEGPSQWNIMFVHNFKGLGIGINQLFFRNYLPQHPSWRPKVIISLMSNPAIKSFEVLTI